MLLSIIIPTKNRYTTLFSVVDMIISFNLNDNIEIVIQDNSDDNNMALDFIGQKVKYSNLKYFHSSENLSVIENSDRAVLNSTGEFVCFIGDDDGVMPNIVEVTKWMKANNYKALKGYKPTYYWPNQKSNFLSNDTSGVLKFKSWNKSSFEIIKTNDALDYTLKRAGMTLDMLPCLYHGIVERKALDLIYQKTNTYFPGPSPDMANAIALTQVIDSFVFVGYPVIISGQSPTSTGGAGVLHQHVAKIEDVKHLPKDTSLNWDKRIPKYWTGPTIWAESVIKALEKFHNKEAIEKFNFNYLYAWLSVFHKRDFKEIFTNFPIRKSPKLVFVELVIFLFRVRVFIGNRVGFLKSVRNLKNMHTAVEVISKI